MRERLIGAAVLVIIAVILIPWLVSRSHHPRDQVRTLPVPEAASGAAPTVLTLPPLPSSKAVAAGVEAEGKTKVDRTTAPVAASAVVARAEAAQPDSMPVATDAKAAATTSTKPSGEAKPTPEAVATRSAPIEKGDWYLQVASFSSRDNARSMVEKLEKANFDARVATHKGRNKIWYRVRVGPFPDKTAARAAAKRLQVMNGSQPIVRQADGSGG